MVIAADVGSLAEVVTSDNPMLFAQMFVHFVDRARSRTTNS
jgi:hypothetical protein